MNKHLSKNLALVSILLSGLISSGKVLAIEPKEPENVDLNSLIQETQNSSSNDGMSLVWWLPHEFWEVAFSQDESLSEVDRQELLNILEPYFMLGVVQGEISPLGNAKFYDLEQVKNNLTLAYENNDGTTQTLAPAAEIAPEVELLQNTVRPILEQMMGNLGRNFHFLTFEDRSTAGIRQISPYEDGKIIVNLSGNSEIAPSNFTIDLPLNALYVPRICPNGKEAHISWQYCPWDGSKLEQ